MKKIPLREPAELSCKVLAEYLERGDLSLWEREYLLKDFWWKARGLLPDAGRRYLIQVFKTIMPEGSKSLVDMFEASSAIGQEPADVAIVTVIKEELAAAKIAFGIEKDQEDRRVHGFRYWHASTKDAGGKELKVVITMVGEARNVPCAVACGHLFDGYKVDLCLLVGIAAGLKEKVSLCDVVAASLVLDYEGARMERKGRGIRPQQFTPDPQISRDQFHFDPRTEWHQHFLQCLSKLRQKFGTPLEDTGPMPKYHSGVILSGEKLLADGSLPLMQKEYHQQVLAAEMEGSGFARVCIDHGVPWLVFRGISDFGDDKKRTLENWKATAALSAATAAHSFLKKDYRQGPF